MVLLVRPLKQNMETWAQAGALPGKAGAAGGARGHLSRGARSAVDAGAGARELQRPGKQRGAASLRGKAPSWPGPRASSAWDACFMHSVPSESRHSHWFLSPRIQGFRGPRVFFTFIFIPKTLD